jgi:hypothetical protein
MCYCLHMTQHSNGARAMNYDNYEEVVAAINVYDDIVLYEAQKLAFAICKRNENYCTDSLFDAINESVDELGVQNCWQHTELRNAIDLYNDEQTSDAVLEIVIAMIKRSNAWELAFN